MSSQKDSRSLCNLQTQMQRQKVFHKEFEPALNDPHCEVNKKLKAIVKQEGANHKQHRDILEYFMSAQQARVQDAPRTSNALPVPASDPKPREMKRCCSEQ